MFKLFGNAKETNLGALTLKWGQRGLTVRSSCSKTFFFFPFSSLPQKKKKKNLSDSNRCRISSVIFFVNVFLPLTLTNERACTWRKGTRGRTYLAVLNRAFEFWDDSRAKFDTSKVVYRCNINIIIREWSFTLEITGNHGRGRWVLFGASVGSTKTLTLTCTMFALVSEINLEAKRIIVSFFTTFGIFQNILIFLYNSLIKFYCL